MRVLNPTCSALIYKSCTVIHVIRYMNGTQDSCPQSVCVANSSQSTKLYGGLPSSSHYKIRDVTADLLSVVCHIVSTELELQPLSGELLSHAQNSKH